MANSVKESDSALVARVYDNYQRAKAYRSRIGWDKKAHESVDYFFGDQWTDDEKRELALSRRAPAVFNMILPVVDTITGNHIEGRADLIAKPVDQYTDPELADMTTGVIKNIEQTNDVVYIERDQFMDGMFTGIGIKEMNYNEDSGINGKLDVFQTFSWDIFLDPSFTKYDYSDGNILIKRKWLSEKDVKRIYGKKVADKINFDSQSIREAIPEQIASSTWDDNVTDYDNRTGRTPLSDRFDEYAVRYGYDPKNRMVLALEQYEHEWEEVEYYMDADGQWQNADVLSEEEYAFVEDMIVKKQEQYVRITTIVGMVLAEDKKTDVPHINKMFNLFFPYFYRGKYMGIIDNLKYPQDEINKEHSTIIHILNSMANNGVFYQEGAFDEETEASLETELAKNGTAIKMAQMYDDSGHPMYVERSGTQVQPEFERIIARGKEDIKYIGAAFDNMQGRSERRESGAAKRIEVERASLRMAGIQDNFFRSKKMAGRAYVWWIQNRYTDERVIRIMGERPGEQDLQITINHDAMGTMFNDMTIGEYDLVLEFEGKTVSERERWYYRMIELANVVPMYAPILGREVMRNSGLPKAEEIVNEMVQMQQQQQQMAAAGANIPNRGGPITSAPRPSRGPRRQPQATQ